MEFINPCGAYQRIDTPLAARKPLAEVKCVGLFSNRKHNADLFLNKVAERLKQHHPHLEFEVFKKVASSPADFSDQWLSKVNAVVAAFGDWGSCTSWCIHDTIVLEKQGIPTATVCTDEFFGLGKAEAESLGMPGLPIAVVPHPAAEQTHEGIAAFANGVTDKIIHMLDSDAVLLEAESKRSRDIPGKFVHRYPSVFENDYNKPNAGQIIDGPESLEAVNDFFYQRGWTDGLPIVPPTKERWDRMLGGRNPGDEIGLIEPRLGMATVGNVAANAVMAGAAPDALPVILAAARAMTDERLNLKGLQTTTHSCAVMALVHGPIAGRLNINAGTNAMGQGVSANATIGRAIRFVLNNVGGGVPGVMDRSTMGTPAKYTFCFAENIPANPWEPLHVELGFKENDNAVTLFGCEGPHNVNDHRGDRAEEILTTIAGTMATPGCNNAKYNYEYLVVIGPEHAEIIRRDGFSKKDVKRFLVEHAVIPRHYISRPQMDMYVAYVRSERILGPDGKDGLRLINGTENLMIAVSGGAGRHSCVIPTFGNTRPVTVPVL